MSLAFGLFWALRGDHPCTCGPQGTSGGWQKSLLWPAAPFGAHRQHSTAPTAHASPGSFGRLQRDYATLCPEVRLLPWGSAWEEGQAPAAPGSPDFWGFCPPPAQAALWTLDGQYFATALHARDYQHQFTDQEMGPSEGGAGAAELAGDGSQVRATCAGKQTVGARARSWPPGGTRSLFWADPIPLLLFWQEYNRREESEAAPRRPLFPFPPPRRDRTPVLGGAAEPRRRSYPTPPCSRDVS